MGPAEAGLGIQSRSGPGYSLLSVPCVAAWWAAIGLDIGTEGQDLPGSHSDNMHPLPTWPRVM